MQWMWVRTANSERRCAFSGESSEVVRSSRYSMGVISDGCNK